METGKQSKVQKINNYAGKIKDIIEEKEIKEILDRVAYAVDIRVPAVIFCRT